MNKYLLLIIMVIFLLLLSACGASAPQEPAKESAPAEAMPTSVFVPGDSEGEASEEEPVFEQPAAPEPEEEQEEPKEEEAASEEAAAEEAQEEALPTPEAKREELSAANIWTIGRIPVCWENPSAANAEGRQWVQAAVEGAWERESGLDFVNWHSCADNSQGLRILIRDEAGERPHVAALGYHLNGLKNGIILNFAFRNVMEKCADMRKFCIEVLAVHEFGHALGFAHEQNRSDAPFNCQVRHNGSEPVLYLTPYDLYSVMNYCHPEWGGNGKLSEFDIEGVRKIYGSPDDTSPPDPDVAGNAFIHLYKKTKAQGDPFCTLLVESAVQVIDFTNNKACPDNSARSMALQNIPGGTVLQLYNHRQGKRNKGWLEIVVEADISHKVIPNFTQAMMDDDLRLTYHPGDNSLDRAVSRLDITNIPAGAVIDLYDDKKGKGDLTCSILLDSLSASGPNFLNFRKADCENNAARSLVLYEVAQGETILLFDDAAGDRNGNWLEITTEKFISRKVIPTFAGDFQDNEVTVTYHGQGNLDKKVSRLERVISAGE